MAVTKQDLRDFARFADEKLEHGVADSLVALAGEWESRRREMEETVSDIRQSHVEIEAGKLSTVADAFADARRQLDAR
jgi:hypothetical protein